ncbi:hypothetical protein WR25_15018 [Diploscapter pachys]|uniref:ENTH domain-containing protein n=1 Tax=Diploscapter pachys TaxID=2018661 RepID=A0A2A2JA95_9BILA|nr:hypothetical protein WR25_15018 [Diploscapter pachys]
MSVSKIRRNIKNVAYNFSPAQIKTREATSNDEGTPSVQLMTKIAECTVDGKMADEVLVIIWKRLSDSGRNWRHVYKSLILLQYLIINGSERIVRKIKQQIFHIKTLKDFEHHDGDLNRGIFVRDLANEIVNLLQDDKRLAEQRQHGTQNRHNEEISRAREQGRKRGENGLEEDAPANTSEEELQLQVAMALSKEEQRKKEEVIKSDEYRLQLAVSESCKEVEKTANQSGDSSLSQSAIDDLLSLGLGEPPKYENSIPNSVDVLLSSSASASAVSSAPPASVSSDHFTLIDSNPYSDPPNSDLPPSSGVPTTFPVTFESDNVFCDSGIGSSRSSCVSTNSIPNFNEALLPTHLGPTASVSSTATLSFDSKKLENFLGSYKNLVDLNCLVGPASQYPSIPNAGSVHSDSSAFSSILSSNPFHAALRKPTLAEMRSTATK